jgi:hypothetical protein
MKGPLSICFKNKKKTIEWMQTIKEFKECQVDITNIKKDNKMLMDFGKVNKLMKDKESSLIKPELTLMYDNDSKITAKDEPTHRKEIVVNKLMKKIVTSITQGSIQNEVLKRKMKDELKKTKIAAREMKKKEDLIRDIVQKRIELENKKKDELRNIEAKNK